MTELGLFAKHWTPSAVKTRLAVTTGVELAAAWHRLFLATLLDRFRAVADRRTLVYAPANQAAAFAELAGDAWRLAVQSGGDLGLRMQAFCEQARQAGAQRIVLIGADSPTLPRESLERAFAWLREFPAVLGPATDGGYYLLGLSTDAAPPIFANMAWGTSTVLDETCHRLANAGIGYRLLPEWSDVDTAHDLAALRRHVTSELADDAEFAALRAFFATHWREEIPDARGAMPTQPET